MCQYQSLSFIFCPTSFCTYLPPTNKYYRVGNTTGSSFDCAHFSIFNDFYFLPDL